MRDYLQDMLTSLTTNDLCGQLLMESPLTQPAACYGLHMLTPCYMLMLLNPHKMLVSITAGACIPLE